MRVIATFILFYFAQFFYRIWFKMIELRGVKLEAGWLSSECLSPVWDKTIHGTVNPVWFTGSILYGFGMFVSIYILADQWKKFDPYKNWAKILFPILWIVQPILIQQFHYFPVYRSIEFIKEALCMVFLVLIFYEVDVRKQKEKMLWFCFNIIYAVNFIGVIAYKFILNIKPPMPHKLWGIGMILLISAATWWIYPIVDVSRIKSESFDPDKSFILIRHSKDFWRFIITFLSGAEGCSAFYSGVTKKIYGFKKNSNFGVVDFDIAKFKIIEVPDNRWESAYKLIQKDILEKKFHKLSFNCQTAVSGIVYATTGKSPRYFFKRNIERIQ